MFADRSVNRELIGQSVGDKQVGRRPVTWVRSQLVSRRYRKFGWAREADPSYNVSESRLEASSPMRSCGVMPNKCTYIR